MDVINFYSSAAPAPLAASTSSNSSSPRDNNNSHAQSYNTYRSNPNEDDDSDDSDDYDSSDYSQEEEEEENDDYDDDQDYNNYGSRKQETTNGNTVIARRTSKPTSNPPKPLISPNEQRRTTALKLKSSPSYLRSPSSNEGHQTPPSPRRTNKDSPKTTQAPVIRNKSSYVRKLLSEKPVSSLTSKEILQCLSKLNNNNNNNNQF